MNVSELLGDILYRSKEFKMDGPILRLKDYNSGKEINLHLGVLLQSDEGETILEEMVIRAQEYDDGDYEY